MKRITDSSFKYRPSHETDIRATFRRVIRERLEAEKRDEENKREAAVKAIPQRRVA